MANTAFIYLAMGIGALIGLGVGLWLQRRYGSRRRDQAQRRQMIVAGLMLLFFSPMIYRSLFITEQYWIAGGFLASCAVMLAGALRRQNETDRRTNFALDPEHCGQCSYDLRGTDGPTCPECGWRIPAAPPPYQRPNWALWWCGWHVEYLDNWKRCLATHMVFMPAFIALAIWLWWISSYVFSAIAALMALHMTINTFRVVQYARRNQPGSGEGS